MHDTLPPVERYMKSQVVTGDAFIIQRVNGYAFQLFACDLITRDGCQCHV